MLSWAQCCPAVVNATRTWAEPLRQTLTLPAGTSPGTLRPRGWDQAVPQVHLEEGIQECGQEVAPGWGVAGARGCWCPWAGQWERPWPALSYKPPAWEIISAETLAPVAAAGTEGISPEPWPPAPWRPQPSLAWAFAWPPCAEPAQPTSRDPRDAPSPWLLGDSRSILGSGLAVFLPQVPCGLCVAK